MTINLNIDNSNSLCKRIKRSAKKACNMKTLKRRLPIIAWLPQYTSVKLFQDAIAGITVGLTAIPQGIAYAIVAGLSPEYGLYSSLAGGFIYLLFGSCKDVTIGPTAILAAMVGKYISEYTTDFAILCGFLAGVVQILLGIFHMGFLVEFISMPVISGFTTAASLQIAVGQLKSFFGLAGPSGTYFLQSVLNFYKNIKTIQVWDPILGSVTIIMLFLLKRLGKGCSRTDDFAKATRWFISLARNAIVVVFGMIVAYTIKQATDTEPLALIGEINGGIPKFKLPPFYTVTKDNVTLEFTEMIQLMGPSFFVIPFVAILETVAIAKAFAFGAPVDASQEMLAVGLCNCLGSFFSSMPITGSFTRTALNYASGVQTTAGGVFTGLLIISALSLFTSTFYYIPKASLAGLIITAMYYMIDIVIFSKLWKNNKKEFIVSLFTIGLCLIYGLEYGIIGGVVTDACFLIYSMSRPVVEMQTVKNDDGWMIVIPLVDKVLYCAADHVRRIVLKASLNSTSDVIIVIDGNNLKAIDSTVASNLMSLGRDLQNMSKNIVFWNFCTDLQKFCIDSDPKFAKNFISTPNRDELIKLIN